jgi:hypothetical protein
METNFVLRELADKGFYVGESFLQGDDLIKLQDSCTNILMNVSHSDYKFGKAVRIGSLEVNKIKNPAISKAFEHGELNKIRDAFLNGNCNFTEIFLTHEFTNSKGVERNGYLHFDRIWTFKYFYYLSDVITLDDGPLRVVPASHYMGAKLRSGQFGKPYEQQNNRVEIDYPEIYEDIQDSIKPIFGKAGTLIIFNTDTFHMGGNVTSNNERKVCRLHMRRGNRDTTI